MAAFQNMLGVVAGTIIVISYFPYIYTILKRKTKPSKATWFIWGILAVLTALGMWEAETLSFQMTAIVVGDVFVIALAFMGYGSSGWTKMEICALFAAGLGFVLWKFTDNPNIIIAIGLGLTAVGSIPTITKTWHFPLEEDGLAFTLMVASCLVQFCAIPGWSFADVAQPVVFFFIGATILFLIRIRPRYV